VGAFDKGQPGQFAHQLAVNAGLKVEVKLAEGFDPGQAGQLEASLNAALMATIPLGLQGLRQKGNRVLYRAPEPAKKGQRGRPKSHGQRLKLNEAKTLGKADEVQTVFAEDGGWIEIAIWKHMHVYGCCKVA
jgi:hypothetical protein